MKQTLKGLKNDFENENKKEIKLTGLTIADRFGIKGAGEKIEFDINEVEDWGSGRMYGRGNQKLLIAKIKNQKLHVWVAISKQPKEIQKKLKEYRDANEYCPYPYRGIYSVNFKKRGNNV